MLVFMEVKGKEPYCFFNFEYFSLTLQYTKTTENHQRRSEKKINAIFDQGLRKLQTYNIDTPLDLFASFLALNPEFHNGHRSPLVSSIPTCYLRFDAFLFMSSIYLFDVQYLFQTTQVFNVTYALSICIILLRDVYRSSSLRISNWFYHVFFFPNFFISYPVTQ